MLSHNSPSNSHISSQVAGPITDHKSQYRSTIRARLSRLTDAALKSLLEKSEFFLKHLERSYASENLPSFLSQVVKMPEEISYYPHLKHVREWMTLVMSEQKLLVEAARDHFKTTFFSFHYPLYRVQKVRRQEDAFGIAVFSYAEGQAQKYLKRIRMEIETNPSLRWLMPKAKYCVWDTGTLDMSNGCYIEAYGLGSSFRGRHPLIAIIDDPSKDDGTGAMPLERLVEFFCSVIIPAVKPGKKGGQIIVTGNPVDMKDFLGWLEENPSFSRHFYPVMNQKGEPLAPEHYDLEAIAEKRKSIPPHLFSREYMLKRVSSADARFKESWIHYYEPGTIEKKVLYKVMTIDPALSPGGDAMASVVTGTDAIGNIYVLDHISHRGDLMDGIGKLVDMMVRHYPDFIGCEKFALQTMYKISLESEIAKRGESFYVRDVGGDSHKKKKARIESLQPPLSKGRIFFRQEDSPIADQLILWNQDSKTNDDDLIDALGYQVPLWQQPGEEPKAAHEIIPGTFEDVFKNNMRSKRGGSYITRLFEDFHNA